MDLSLSAAMLTFLSLGTSATPRRTRTAPLSTPGAERVWITNSGDPMLRSALPVLLSISLAASLGTAQAPAPAPAAAPRAPLVSPEVRSDGTITLRFRAPDARQVTVVGELDGKTYPMTKDASGVWSVTLGPWPHDVYNYQFNVDGVIAMDPANPSVKLGFGAFPPASMVEVPGRGLEFDDARPVPHGSVRMETYHSSTLGVPRTLWVYTPPGYDGSTAHYPVFYLLHGSGNIDSSWMLTGRANLIMDNLIAEGRARPMIIVNPFGYARQGVGLGPELATTAAPAAAPAPQDSPFAKDLLQDVIPFIERTFRTLPGAENRALGGLSMGGGQTVAIGFAHPDLFRSLVIMSAGSNNADQLYPAFFDAPRTNQQIKLLWMGVGKDDTLVGASAKALDAALTAKGINHTFRLTEGRHEWVVWRHHLNEVAPLLFR
jgi:enterochelin esterase-like enzyme